MQVVPDKTLSITTKIFLVNKDSHLPPSFTSVSARVQNKSFL